ncbi:CAMK family protein kinase [Trichomonas vaginalis G3]|uniref:CAMK family protein kinase n=1 Tax=Trichomonas vaginalis (strain ATCC PRA-98 / G3) TaxID=412133 RepID=A2EBT2_TRIV3|nr:MAP kinase kinase protein [Trichomonas vaginalis G3]EAY09894.1 CAMK family protein kinase [Trichomonas vaginalis G3]KAI5514666.1 MAP kinase kinase protein [Trichomonas vaginalis G3]|eukprot:XP_001322117.1 CAMK family protein kinase [Trichomonas vaginalis G3]
MNSDEISFLKQHGIIYLHTIGTKTDTTVFLVSSKQYQSNFALTKIPKSRFDQQMIDLLISIDDPKMVHIFKYYEYNNYIYLLMEFCPFDLERQVKGMEKKVDITLNKYVTDVIYAVKSFHDKSLAHCHIKPSKFFIDKFGRIKIGDFLDSIICEEDNEDLKVETKRSKMYQSPEMIKNKKYNPFAADIWALGVTIYNIYTNKYPFQITDSVSLQTKIETGNFSKEEIADHYILEIVSKCLIPDPSKRFTIDQILNLSFFKPKLECSDQKILLQGLKFPSSKSVPAKQNSLTKHNSISPTPNYASPVSNSPKRLIFTPKCISPSCRGKPDARFNMVTRSSIRFFTPPFINS